MELLDKFQACMVLHALGDTIGFKNGDWEFNYGQRATIETSNDRLFEFISLGGINQVDLKGWIVSDDTIMHMSTAEVLIGEYKDVEEFAEKLADQYVKDLFGEGTNIDSRAPGDWIIKSIGKLKEGLKWNEFEYNELAGGNGAAMRSSCIGLLFSGKKKRNDLIMLSIEAGRITHNSVIGYLGSLVSALFTAFALEKIAVEKWPFELLEILESGKIEKYLKKTRGLEEYQRDKDIFIDMWRKYIELRFKNDKPTYPPAMRVPSYRTSFYIDHFLLKKGKNYPGIMGHDSVIIAYDALLDAVHSPVSWEKLVTYSMLHAGDSDTTGAIAGSWYGAMYGFHDVPDKNLKYLEFKHKLMDLGEKLYNKSKKFK